MKSPRQHQISALEATRINNKGIINLPTGTGKSYIQSLNIIDNINKSKVFVVISPRILLADQLLEEIRKDLEEKELEEGDEGKVPSTYLVHEARLTDEEEAAVVVAQVGYYYSQFDY